MALHTSLYVKGGKFLSLPFNLNTGMQAIIQKSECSGGQERSHAAIITLDFISTRVCQYIGYCAGDLQHTRTVTTLGQIDYMLTETT